MSKLDITCKFGSSGARVGARVRIRVRVRVRVWVRVRYRVRVRVTSEGGGASEEPGREQER